MAQQVLALRGQSNSAAYPIEQRYSELKLKGPDLSRKGRLAHMQALGRASKTAGIDDGREGAEMAKVHGPER
jgi:hypothetical protein